MSATPAVLIIGIGSPYGDDRLGLEAIAALRQDPYVRAQAKRIALRAADRPGARLIDLWHGAKAVVLIDGMVTGAAFGTVHRLEEETIARAGGSHPASTHHFGVAETVALARQLGVVPGRLILYGVEIGETGGQAAPGSAMDAALARLTVQVVDEVKGWLDEDKG
ncbi:hydrogenase [Sulfurifustis variabilis]|uniref:Hydrogenase n=1 Tax=Sulfurifustis variabilis TaxID=1675686 RepID=A0A1B4VAJ3_9GAMM|nr:hydrogenase maturation protease [Sulfurifustis variabilis]BAU48704.1 hydrogenase [Sulfurifustis variabilis]